MTQIITHKKPYGPIRLKVHALMAEVDYYLGIIVQLALLLGVSFFLCLEAVQITLHILGLPYLTIR